jgi:hypothetical protein
LSGGSLRTYLAVIALSLGLAGAAAAADRPPVWEQAARAHKSAMSAYGSQQWQQARGLFEQFIRKFNSHERVPEAHLYLARCLGRLEDPNGALEALETVIRRYTKSAVWFVATARKLGMLKSRKAHDEFLAALEKMVRYTTRLPLDFARNIRLHHGAHWYTRHDRQDRRPRQLPWLRPILPRRDIEADILDVADTPERAKRALKILDRTFREHEEDLPANWQLAHYLLLSRAQAPQAEPQIATYRQQWQDDPRGMALWFLWAVHCQEAGDDKAADAAYAHLLDNYLGYATLSVLLDERVAHLADQGRHEAFVALARQYLKTYPEGRLRKHILRRWLDMLRPAALGGDAGALDEILHVLDTHYGRHSNARRSWLIDFYIERKEDAKAVQLARAHLDPNRWSANAFHSLERYAQHKCESFAVLVAAARRAYGIHEPAGGKAADLLEQLKKRLKDDQVRHMEEIGEKLFTAHRETAEAVEAVRLLGEYYFKKVLPEPRDRWMDRMIDAYPRHPQTQAVLALRVRGLRAGRRYQQVGEALDLLHERFPTAHLPFNWFHYRLSAYRAVKDERGRVALIRKRYGPQAERGNTYALRRIAELELDWRDEQTTTAQVGGFWMDWAKKLKGTRAELFCLHEAVNAYYATPKRHPGLGKEPLPDKALEVIKVLQTQPLDPEVRWNMAFADINILADLGRGGEALSRLKERIGERQRIRDLHQRLNLGRLAEAFGTDAEVAREGLSYFQQLGRLCFTSGDRQALASAEARLYYEAGAYAQARDKYMGLVTSSPWPVRAYGSYRAAFRAARRISPHAARAVADRYVSLIARCQDVLPDVLYELGREMMGSRPALAAVRRMLADRYPASSPRGKLEQEIRRRLERAAERRRGG